MTHKTSHKKGVKHRLSRTVSIELLVCIVAIVLVSVALYWNTPSKQKSNYCSHDIEFIDHYNKTVKEQGVTKMQDITKILNEKRIADDATCTYMLMITQYGDNSTKQEQETYQKLKQLESKGQNVSDKINDGIDRAEVENFIQRKIDEKDKGYYGEG